MSGTQHTYTFLSSIVQAMDKAQMTPLHIASVYGHDEIARMLIKIGCNIRCKDEENGTPLHLAAAEGNLEVIILSSS